MAISNVTSAATSAFSAQQQAASQKSSQDPQQNPLVALQRKISGTNTQLSVFGKVKLSLDDLQAKAQALKGFEKSPNLNDLKIVVLGFVQAFNSARTVVTKSTQTQEALANDTRASRALSEVSRAVAEPNNEGSRTALEKLGITLQKDGTLAVDEKKLENAFQADQSGTLDTLANLGQRVGQAAGQQLSGKNGTGTKAVDLTEIVNEVDKQQKALQQRLEAQKNAQQQQAAQLASLAPSSGSSPNSAAANAVATYIGVATM